MTEFCVVTLFPELVQAVAEHGVVGRAADRSIVNLQCVNPRDFATDAHRTVDDRPYGGGPGMVMKYEPLAASVAVCTTGRKAVKTTSPISPVGLVSSRWAAATTKPGVQKPHWTPPLMSTVKEHFDREHSPTWEFLLSFF